MSLVNTDNKVTYQGNGATTTWPIPFPVLEDSHLKVVLSSPPGVETYLTSDYNVDLTNMVVTYPGYESGQEPPEAGQPEKLPTGWKITLLRQVPLTQETDLGDRWPFKEIEDMSDRTTMQVQQLAEELARTFKIPIAHDLTPDQLLASIEQSEASAAASATAAQTAKDLAEELALQDFTGTMRTADVITKGPWVDVRAFGAKGDGVTDDTASIVAADSHANLTGKRLYFPAGVYYVGGRSSALTPTVSWIGDSHWYNQWAEAGFAPPDKGSVIDGGNSPVDIIAGNLTALELRGLTIKGSGNGACLSFTSGSRGCTVYGCSFYGKQYGVRISGAVTYLITIERCFVVRQESHGIFVDIGSGMHNAILLRNNWVFRQSGSGIYASGTTGGCTLLTIEDNSITDGSGDNAAIVIRSVQGLRIANNNIEGWGAVYSDPEHLTGKTGYNVNARCLDISASCVVISGNMTYGCGSAFSPLRILSSTAIQVGPNRFLKDISTQAYAISCDAATVGLSISKQVTDFAAPTLIASGAVNFYDYADGALKTNAAQTFTGGVRLQGGVSVLSPVLFNASPPVVASGSTITLPDAPVVIISGTTSITYIGGKSRQIVILEFQGALTVVDSPPGVGNLRLNGDFVTTAGSTLTLMARGESSSWVELSRSSN